MRDPNRLYKFYAELQKIQSTYCPDLTFENFNYAFLDQYGRDPFFPEEDEYLKAVEKWAKERTQPEWDGKVKFDSATYDKFRDIHKEYFPDWRFGQLLVNFLGCVPQSTTFLGDKKILKYFEQFAHCVRPHD
jgi:hypothetical protein